MLNWNTTETKNYIIHATSVTETTETDVRKAIETCTDKAISLLDNNIQDDSLYLLFEWNASKAMLVIVITDVTKMYDAPESVSCVFSGTASELAKGNEERCIAYSDSVKFWLHDYLTTCTAFFSYSLVAIFHSSDRNNTELL